MVVRASLFSILLVIISAVHSFSADSYREDLIIRRLQTHRHLLTQFKFVAKRFKPIGNHYTLFPSVIGHVVKSYNLEELHLSLTQGYWRHRSWGPSPEPSAPTGAQLWVWFADENDIDTKYKNLVHTLSGFFCASLEQIYPTLTGSPQFVFRPTGNVTHQDTVNSSRLRYSILANENVCTENLTPWKKLLPCKNKGLSQLLNPTKLLESNFYSISLDLRRVCDDDSSCKEPHWELSQTIIAVMDLDRTGRNDGFRISGIFDSYRLEDCALASHTRILVHNQNASVTAPFVVDGEYLSVDLKSTGENAVSDPTKAITSIEVTYADGQIQKEADINVTIHSYLAGTGQQEGWIKSLMENKASHEQEVVYTHVIPAFLRVYLHTLDIHCHKSQQLRQLTPKKMQFVPGRLRNRPYTLSLILSLPSQSTCTLSINFEKSLLRWTEYPPDAHRGFVIPGPSLTLQANNSSSVLHSEALLVSLPTPDFSMPYNVICLVCTVVALAFGPIHNLTTKTMVLTDPEEIKKKGLLYRLKQNLRRVFSRKGGDQTGKENVQTKKED